MKDRDYSNNGQMYREVMARNLKRREIQIMDILRKSENGLTLAGIADESGGRGEMNGFTGRTVQGLLKRGEVIITDRIEGYPVYAVNGNPR